MACEVIYNRFIDGVIGCLGDVGEIAKRNESRKNLREIASYHSARAALSCVIMPYISLCRMMGFDSSDE